MLSDSDYEWLYVHYYEMETDELASVTWEGLSDDEMHVIFDVLLDRRQELNDMIDMLSEESTKLKKRSVRVPLPAEIVAKLRAYLTDQDSMVS